MSLQNLFVAKLPRNIGDADLLQIFADYHPSSAKIMLDAYTGKSKGFGFVLFDVAEDGEKAYKALNRTMTRCCGHNFTLVIYPSNHDGKIFTEETNTLYIRNIPMSVGQDRVERFLRTFGNLIYFAMREDHYGSPVWVIYAEYETVEVAKNALAKLHGNNTYFHGAAPILAKFEDSSDAKKERRRRRDGAQSHAPSSGCIFPPPREHSEAHSQSLSSHPPTDMAHTHVVESKAHTAGSSCSPQLLSTEGGGIGAEMPTPSPPSYLASLNEVPPQGSFSLPQQLLQPTPGYCYTLADSGQQIFIPATSFSPSLSSFSYSPVAQSAPAMPPGHVPPTLLPQLSPQLQAMKPSFSLLDPEPISTVVVMEGGQQFVLSPDAINMKQDRLAPGSQSHSLLLPGSPSKTRSLHTLGGAGRCGSSSSAAATYVPNCNSTLPSPSFMVTQTSHNTNATPILFVPYNAPPAS